MSGVTPEIAADFLLEAGEIVEKLGGQLVELEKRPADAGLLNAIFRGFHTVKGGAGFLNLAPLVEVCHAAEDLFNLLRAGARSLDAELLDDILKCVDAVQQMMQALGQGADLAPADPALIARLRAAAHGTARPKPKPEPAPAATPPADTISEDEFEALLDRMHGAGAPGAKGPQAPAPANDTISEDEFDAVLDQMHGKAGAPGLQPAAAPARPAVAPAAKSATSVPADTTVRVETRRLDRLMNLVGELVLVRNRFITLRSHAAASGRNEELERSIASLDQITGALQSAVMQTRMQPIGKLFARFPKVTRDVARTLDKKVELRLKGEDTDLDKNLVEALADPLVHLLRNAVDHGIEAPAERRRRGKPESGTVELAAQQEGDHILITIRDDGAGMDPEILRTKAREKGLLSADAAAALDAQGCFQLIFLPGFSTKAEISEVSGRGVGMDVVKSRLTELNGSISIDSERGRGSTIALKVPLTLAILPALMVVVGGRRYALPLTAVQEVFQYDPGQLRWMDRREVLSLRKESLPLWFLARLLGRGAEPGAHPHVVVVQVGEQRHGLVVDEVLGREEVVIKPLGALLQKLPGFAGGTITGDGRIALIADLPALLKSLNAGPKSAVPVH